MLDRENIAKSTSDVEWHPLKPFLPENAKVLFLGSFPPQRNRGCMDFFYPNWINDHWRIEGEVFFGDKTRFVDESSKTFLLDDIVSFLSNKGIALFDTATAVRRLQNNASDKFLEVVVPTDIDSLLASVPHCRAIVTTGEKATVTLCEKYGIKEMPKVGPYVGIPERFNADGEQLILYRLPSSSRAYPLAFAKKVEAYRKMFLTVGLI
jgi:G:T/U-mismatch repair DNA glycosylase